MEAAGGQAGPDSLAESAARMTAGALGHRAVDDHKAEGLLRAVVGGLPSGRGEESEIGLAVLAEALGHVDHRLAVRAHLRAVGTKDRGVEGGLNDLVLLAVSPLREIRPRGWVVLMDQRQEFLDRF